MIILEIVFNNLILGSLQKQHQKSKKSLGLSNLFLISAGQRFYFDLWSELRYYLVAQYKSKNEILKATKSTILS
jgi:hypothetical protein